MRVRNVRLTSRVDQAFAYCAVCHEDFCEVCFAMLHRTGSRRKHSKRLLHASNDAHTNGGEDGVDKVHDGDDTIDGTAAKSSAQAASNSDGNVSTADR